MELNILYGIQGIRSPGFDVVMVKIFNDFVGSKGEIWLILGIVLLLIPKTRKVAVCLLSSYILAYYIGDGILKDLIARARPCMVDESIELLIKRPTSFSCPSVHSMLAFACAGSIFWYDKKLSIPALVFAALIGFSRMYFFVHFPTDVLFGSVLGFAVATAVCMLFKAADRGEYRGCKLMNLFLSKRKRSEDEHMGEEEMKDLLNEEELENVSGCAGASEKRRWAKTEQYSVVPGDSMYRIAERYGVSYSELVRHNRQFVNPRDIRPGDIVLLPAGE